MVLPHRNSFFKRGKVGYVSSPSRTHFFTRTQPSALMMQKRNFNRKEHREWRQKLIDRDKGCIICGATKMMSAHHLLPDCVKYREFQFDPTNGVILCPGHHIWGIMSAHKNPLWFRKWMFLHRLGTLQLAEDRLTDLEDLGE